MDHLDAMEFIRPVVGEHTEVWADIGAGSGTFTLALAELLPGGHIYAVDKSPHILYTLGVPDTIELHVVEGDFHKPLALPEVDAILMANALHYTSQPLPVIRNVLGHLRPGGKFVLIEYETFEANRWVPYPVRFDMFRGICMKAGLEEPKIIGTRPTLYGHQYMYAALTFLE